MTTIADRAKPELAPPGAGLPPPELFVARLMLRWGLWCTNRARSEVQFTRERDAVLRLARGCPPDLATQRVLIKRLPGQEDSSRYWSVYMTMEHLRIVNEGIGRVIDQLARGVVPPGPTSTADVKPGGEVDAAVLGGFEDACARLEQIVAGAADLRTAVNHPHPWFGPLDAGEWYYLAGFHLRLHGTQLERIITGLSAVG